MEQQTAHGVAVIRATERRLDALDFHVEGFVLVPAAGVERWAVDVSLCSQHARATPHCTNGRCHIQ